MKRSSEMFYEPASPLSFPDIWDEILRESHSDLVALSCVSKSLNAWTKAYAEMNEPRGCFGREKWKKYGVEAKNIPVIMIPLKWFKDFDPSKWMLTLFLENIDEKTPLTLISIDRFVSDCKNGKDTFKSNYIFPLSKFGINDKTVKPFKAHWVMLSKDVLGGRDLENGTRGKTFEIQEERVKKAGYEIPGLIDVVVSVFLHNLETGEFLYHDDSNGQDWTLTRVQEQMHGFRITVGGFSALGLYVSPSLYDDYGAIGASCARKSSVIGH